MNSKPYGACVETPSATVFGYSLHLKTFAHKKKTRRSFDDEGLFLLMPEQTFSFLFR